MKIAMSKAVRINLILLVVAALCVTADLLIHLAMPKAFAGVALTDMMRVLTLNLEADSWHPINLAFESWRHGAAPNVYAATFYENSKFQYPPSAVLLGVLPRLFWLENFNLPYQLASFAFFGLLVVCTERIIAQASEGSEGRPVVSAAIRTVLVAAVALTFYPLVKGLGLGQVQIWLNALFAFALLMWISGRRVVAGVAIGLICLIKPQLSVFLLWAVLRREWRFAAAVAATGAIGLAISLAIFGLDDFLEYLKVLSLLADRGEAFYANQSVNGVLNRLMSVQDPVAYSNLHFHTDRLPPHNPLVKYGTLLTSMVILALALIPRRRPDDEGRVFDFCVMALSCTIASPIAWEHHYGLAFPMLALLLVRAWGDARWMIALGVSYALMSRFLRVTEFAAATPFNVVQSYLLAGGLLLLVMLHLAPPRTALRPAFRQDAVAGSI